MFELVLTLSGLLVVGPTGGDWATPSTMEVVVLDGRKPQCAGAHVHEAWLTVESRFLTDLSIASINAYRTQFPLRVRSGTNESGSPTIGISLEPGNSPQQLEFSTATGPTGTVVVGAIGGLAKLSRADGWANLKQDTKIRDLAWERVGAFLTLRGGLLVAGGRATYDDGTRMLWNMTRANQTDPYNPPLEIPDWLQYRIASLGWAKISSSLGWEVELTGRGEALVKVSISNHPTMLMGSQNSIDHFVEYYRHLPDSDASRPVCAELHRPWRIRAASGASSATVLCPPGGWP